MKIHSMISITCALLLSGCVVAIHPVNPRPNDKVLSKEDIQFLAGEHNTKATIEERFGTPPVTDEEKLNYLYLFRWRFLKGHAHAWVISPYGAGHLGESNEFDAKAMLLIQFDETGKVKRFGAYEFPDKIMPSQVIKDWQSDPLPEYFNRPPRLPKSAN